MSHEPPVPAGNQSPFPTHEPKHPPEGKGPPAGAAIARTPERAATHLGKVAISGIVAVGVAAVAAVGAVAYASRPAPKRSGKKRGKR